MRQVINKLITEEDLYGAVDVGLLARVAPGQAVLPDRPAHRDRRGHPRHRRPGPALREIGRSHHQGRLGHRLGGRLRAQAPHPVPVVRPEHRRGAAAQGRACCGRRAPGDRGVQLQWHDPKATLAEGIVSRGDRRDRGRHRGRVAARRHLPGVVASTSTSSCGPTPWRATGCPSTGTCTAHRDRGRGPALGPRLGRAAPRLPLAGLAGRPRRARPRGLPLDALLRLRGLHRLRHRARGGLGRPAGRRQPGHRPGPGSAAGAVPVRFLGGRLATGAPGCAS